jgi:hypothetical protein
MNQRIYPGKIFYVLALVFLGAMALYPSPLLPLTVFYALIAGAVWSFVSTELKVDYPTMIQMLPSVLLLLLMGVLTQVLNRPTSEALFHAVRGLVMFRALVYILRVLQKSMDPITRPMTLLVAAIVSELFFVIVRVYHLIYPLEGMPTWLNWVEAKALAVVVAGLILNAYFKKSRSASNHP